MPPKKTGNPKAGGSKGQAKGRSNFAGAIADLRKIQEAQRKQDEEERNFQQKQKKKQEREKQLRKQKEEEERQKQIKKEEEKAFYLFIFFCIYGFILLFIIEKESRT